MGERSRAFNEVKALLGKLDRSIDEARQRRLDDQQKDSPETDEPKSESGSNREPASDAPPAREDRAGGGSSPGPARKSQSPYGRARPLRRPSGDPNSVGGGSRTEWRQG